MRSNDWLRQAQQKLEQAGVDSSRLDSLILLEHVKRQTRTHSASPDSPLTEEQITAPNDLIELPRQPRTHVVQYWLPGVLRPKVYGK